MFERSPFITCPFCGKETFGILMVTGDSYVRRCAACRRPRGTEQPVRYYLPELNKKIIYLDQFAIRNIYPEGANEKADTSNGVSAKWVVLADRIRKLIKYHLIICPVSEIHIQESVVWSNYKETRGILHGLSRGVGFLNRANIQHDQFIENAKNWTEGKPPLLPVYNSLEGLDKDPNFWPDFVSALAVLPYPEEEVNKIKTIRDDSCEQISDVFKRWQEQKDKDFMFWFDEEIKGYVKIMVANFKEYIQKDQREKLFIKDIINLHSRPTLTILLSLLDLFEERFKTAHEAFSKTAEYLLSDHLKTIPFLKINSMLWASMALKAAAGQKKPPNRGTINDVEFISAYLPYCDAMMIDKTNHSYLSYEPLKTEINYGTKIFSLNNIDDFVDYLNQIEREASPEHWAALEEVYGIKQG